MAEAERSLLAGEAGRAGLRQLICQDLEFLELLAIGKGAIKLEVQIEMILDHGLAASGDEHEMLDAGGARLIDDVLDHRPVDDREHFLGNGLRRRQKSCAEAGYRKHGLANFLHHS